jgi:hypothetical protein
MLFHKNVNGQTKNTLKNMSLQLTNSSGKIPEHDRVTYLYQKVCRNIFPLRIKLKLCADLNNKTVMLMMIKLVKNL